MGVLTRTERWINVPTAREWEILLNFTKKSRFARCLTDRRLAFSRLLSISNQMKLRGEKVMEHTKQKTAERNEQSFALPKKPQKEKWNFKSDLPFYLLLLPAILIVLIFSYVPMTGLILAFKDWNPKLGLWGSPWAADGIFSNFKMLF